jgi:DNA-binding beta-propeller fold protein YncE
MSVRATARLFATLLVTYGSAAWAQPDKRILTVQPFEVEARIPLGDVRGRIDHMALDPSRQRLLVAELENGSVGIVDVKDRKVVRRLTGLKQPQGVGYMASTDTLYVANAGDGSVRLYRGADYAPAGTIELGDDADNVRVDAAARRVVIGYGDGGLAVIDAQTHDKVAEIPLKAHPEGFQLVPSDSAAQIFVNVPKIRAIAVVNLAAGAQITSWRMQVAAGNFPMAVDEDSAQVLSVFRNPPKLGIFSIGDGRLVTALATCGDADDVFVDRRRHRVYISCGEGFVEVFESRQGAYQRGVRTATLVGARTSLFSPELDRYFVAAPAASGQPAAIWVLRPVGRE